MPISIIIPERELFDQKSNTFFKTKERKIELEHSLLSISKWESKWHKPYLSKEQKTKEETIDYIRCMCITKDVPEKAFYALDSAAFKIIGDYITDPMTATTFRKDPKDRPSKEIITNELVYYWMAELGIPFDPCQKWHFNRLMTLIRVTSIKKAPPKKMSKKDWASKQTHLNAQRRARLGSKG